MSMMRRCDGVSRRNAVQVGLGGMLGGGLPGMPDAGSGSGGMPKLPPGFENLLKKK